MKKITTVIAAFMATVTIYAQTDCSSASDVGVGADDSVTISADAVSGTAPTSACNGFYQASSVTLGNWYSYSNSTDIVVTVHSAVPSDQTNGYFPSFNVYSGSCGSLTCEGGSIITTPDGGQTLDDAEYTFIATGGETYYIVFDDYYSTQGLGGLAAFDFDVTTDSAIPDAPDAVTTPTPVDGATDVTINTADDNGDGSPDNSVEFAWEAPTSGPTPTSYEIFLSNPDATDPMALNSLGETPNTSVNITGITGGDTFYWKAVAKNGPVSADNSSTWSFTTETLSVDSNKVVNFIHYIHNDQLVFNSDSPIGSVAIFNLLGQQVVSQEINSNSGNISLSSLNTGVYISKVSINGKIKSFKFVKK